MSAGLLTRSNGLNIAPIPGLEYIGQDWVDDIFAQYGRPAILTRIDPRDVVLTAENPTGIMRCHWAGPHSNPLTFTGTGTSIGVVPGKYNGQRVFNLTAGGAPASYNTLSVAVRSLANVTEFTVFAVMDFDASILGSGFHALVTFLRDRLHIESLIAHQYSASADYITSWADQGDGNGANLLYNGITGPIIAGTPFAIAFRVKNMGEGQYKTDLFINQTVTPAATISKAGAPETNGTMEIRIGNAIQAAHQTPMRFARGYVVAGDAMDTDDKQAIAYQAMVGLRTMYGVP